MTMNEKDEWKDLYNHWLKADHKNEINASTFKKYEKLYQFEELNKAVSYTQEETLEINRLSEEFKLLINPYKPIKIIDDTTGEVVNELPSIFNSIIALNGEYGRNIMSNYNSIYAHASDQPWKVNTVNKQLLTGIIHTQSKDSIMKTKEQFEDLATKFHKKKSIPQSSTTKEEIKQDKNQDNESDDYDVSDLF